MQPHSSNNTRTTPSNVTDCHLARKPNEANNVAKVTAVSSLAGKKGERYRYISDIGGFIFGTPEGAEHNLTLPAAGLPFTFSRGRYPLSAELRLQLSV